MKKVRYIITIGLITIGIAGFAQAKSEDALKTAQMHVTNWAKYLPGVTDDQQKQMVSVENWFITSTKEARTDNANSDEVVAKVKGLSDERNEKMKHILTPSQYSRYMQIYAEEAK